VIKKLERFQEELKNLLIEEEENYEDNKLLEILCVGDGIGEVILHTNELHVLNYKEAMRVTDREHWTDSIKEHERMIENKFWKPMKQKYLPADAKLLSTTWAMKKKANGKYRARITARGFLQEDGVHYFSHSTAVPVANEVKIKIVLTFLVLTTWKAQVIDMKGSFLKGCFTDGENLYLDIPQVFEIFYEKDKVLHLNQTIYVLNQKALAFWKDLLQAFKILVSGEVQQIRVFIPRTLQMA
jgi:hypothetical protein